MAKSMKGAGGFSQMPKMMTDEPSVILKLKKGGHVHKKHEHKEEHGHKSMHHMMDGGVMNALAAAPRGPMPPMAGMAPKRPAMAVRRKAMAAMPTPLMKKGGKAKHHAEGGDIAQDKAMIKKAFKEHDAQEHKGGKGTKLHLKHGGKTHHKFAKGGKVGDKMAKHLDEFETKTTIEHDEKPYVQTEMHDGEHHDSVHGTGSVKEGNAGGYKRGGHAHHKHGGKVHRVSGHPEGSHEHHKHMAKHHAKMHKEGGSIHHKKMMEHHKAMCAGGKYAMGGTVSEKVADRFENTMMVDGEHHDSAHGTGGVRMSNAGGFKHGGKAHHKHHHKAGGSIDKYETRDTYEGGNWENRPADSTPKGKTNTKTGEVKESNAGGYKHGGHAAKKHYATGGSVNKMGSAVVMPQAHKPASKPVHINELSGTFKKGGRVKKFDEGGSTDMSNGGYDSVARQDKADNVAMRNMMLKPITSGINMVKNAMGFGTPPAGSVTKSKESVTVTPPQKKRGGSIKR